MGTGALPVILRDSGRQVRSKLIREHRGQHSLARATTQEVSEDRELDVMDVGDSGSEERCEPQPRFLLGHNRVNGECGAAAADQKSRSGAVGWNGVGRQCAYTSGLHPLYP